MGKLRIYQILISVANALGKVRGAEIDFVREPLRAAVIRVFYENRTVVHVFCYSTGKLIVDKKLRNRLANG